MWTNKQTIKQTDKQTDAAENIHLATPVGDHLICLTETSKIHINSVNACIGLLLHSAVVSVSYLYVCCADFLTGVARHPLGGNAMVSSVAACCVPPGDD